MLFPFNCRTIGANDPWGGAIFDIRAMICMIYVKLHTTIQADNHVFWTSMH